MNEPVRQPEPPAGTPEDTVGARLADTIGGLRRALRRGARVADPGNELSVAQVELLSCVADNAGIRPSQLAARLRLRPNTVTTLVNALEARGMLQRETASGDRRAVTLSATTDGARAVTTWQATNGAVLNLALSGLTGADRRALARAIPALNALASAVDRLADTGLPPGDGHHTAGTSDTE